MAAHMFIIPDIRKFTADDIMPSSQLVISSTISITKPYFCRNINGFGPMLRIKRQEATWKPSRGGIGSMLNTQRPRFIK